MTDPVRLRDPRSPASNELRELIAAARNDLPTGERLRAIAARGGFAAGAGGSGAVVGLAGATKIGAFVLVVAAAAGVLGSRGKAASPASAPAPHEAHVAAAAVAPVTSASPTLAATQAVEMREPPRAAQAARSPRTSGSVRHAPVAPPAPSNDAAPAVLESHSDRAPSTWGSSVPLAPAAPDDRSAPRTLTPEEREVTSIETLVHAGRTDEARERARRFLRVYPGSSHRTEIAALFGFDPGAQNP